MDILPSAEKQGELAQFGGWQEMARRRFQRGSIRKRGKRNPVWELQWWEDYIKPDGTIGRRRESCILGCISEMSVKQARTSLRARGLLPEPGAAVLPGANRKQLTRVEARSAIGLASKLLLNDSDART